MQLLTYLRSLCEPRRHRRPHLPHQQRTLLVERLEDRDLLTTGTTIITHGYTPDPFDPLAGDPTSPNNSDSHWVRQMEHAIGKSAYANTRIPLYLDYKFEAGDLFYASSFYAPIGTKVPSNFAPNNVIHEYIIAVDWADKSNNSDPGWAEAVGDGLAGVLRRYGFGSTDLHFIGHSFGTVVNSEAIQRLGFLDNITVHQMTTLDPHDWDEKWIPKDSSVLVPDVQVWDNIQIADNYFSEAGGLVNPHGRPIPGALNVDLTNLPGFKDAQELAASHTRTHDYYVDTIDPGLRDVHLALLPGQYDKYSEHSWFDPAKPEIIIRSDPFNSNVDEELPRDVVGGWAYSRLGGNWTEDHFQTPLIADVATNAKIPVGGAPFAQPYHTNYNGKADVTRDPPQDIFNGDFFINTGIFPAGYEGISFVRPLPIDKKNFGARLGVVDGLVSGKLEHLPVYFSPTVTGFSFDYYLQATDPDDQLDLSLIADDGTTVTVPLSDLLRNFPTTKASSVSAGSPYTGCIRVNAANAPIFSQLLGKMVAIRFELRSTYFTAPSANIFLDNLDLTRGAVLDVSDGEISVFHDGQANAFQFPSATQGAGGPIQSFVVSNLGQGSMALGPVQVPAGFTVIQQLPSSLASKQSTTFSVQMSTTASGTFTGDISFATSIPGQDPFNFGIEGTVTRNQPTVADLSLHSLQVLDAGVPGGTLRFRTQVSNAGNAISSGYMLNLYLRNNQELSAPNIPLSSQNRTGSSMPPGGYDTNTDGQVTLPSSLAPGTYRLVGTLVPSDPANDLLASNNQQTAFLTLQVTAPANSFRFQFPIGPARTGSDVTGPLGTGFTDHLGHLGTDFAGAQGTSVQAVADGVVTRVFNGGPSWGWIIIIRHPGTAWGFGQDYYSMYAHVEPSVLKDAKVVRGQKIAVVGPKAEGSTATHLHFEIRTGSDAGIQEGKGYRGKNFDRTVEYEFVKREGYQYDIAWHDPVRFIQDHLNSAPPLAEQVDLDPEVVDGPPTGSVGASIQVFTKVKNLWPTSSGSYQVTYLLSTDQNITLRDRSLKTVIRPTIAGNGEQAWTETVAIPSDIAPGRYYIGVSVDPGRLIVEQNDANNEQADSSPITLSSSMQALPDLQGVNAAISPNLSLYDWGMSLTLSGEVINAGGAASTPTTARFVLVDDPLNPKVSYVLGSNPVRALPAGERTKIQLRTLLPATAPLGFRTGLLFVRMEVDPGPGPTNMVVESNETNNWGQDSDWVRLPMKSSQLPDLVGTRFTLNSPQSYLLWGNSLSIDYEFINKGPGDASYYSAEVVMSRDATFSRGNTWLRTISFGVTPPGKTEHVTIPVRLPNAAPDGQGDGRWYMGIILDPDQNEAESQESNNSGQGQGIDYSRLYIVSPPPPTIPAEPVIATFVASPTPIVRGQQVNLSAGGVTDDGVVNDVIFRLDSNVNGQWDESDLYLAHGSKSGTGFTATVSSNASWPTGSVTILARATDNHGLVSAVKTASVTVQGLPTGPFADDVYENNDTEATAAFLGSGTSHQLVNLALTQNDPDFYVFQVLGDAGQISVDLNFTHEAFQGSEQPVGDLTLELRRVNNGSSEGFSDLSSTGNGHEHIVRNSPPSGQWVVIVRGAGSYERNPNYSLDIQITPVAGAPTPGPLVVSRNPVVQGEMITLSMTGITGIPANLVDGVHFYGDFNNNGQIDFDQEYLASDWGPGGEGPNGEYTITTSTANWPLGADSILALVSKVNGPSSLAQVVKVTVLPNNAPIAGSLSAPATAIQGGTVLLTANNVSDSDPGGSVTKVSFTLDSNFNNVLDADDFDLGTGVPSGSNWSATVPTADWTLGIVRVFATPIDNLGKSGSTVTTTVTIQASTNEQPVIGSFSAPDFITKGVPLSLLASSVTDPNGDTLQVQFFVDSDEDGVLGTTDMLLGTGSQNGADWSLTVPTNGFSQGVHRLFAKVTDNGIPSFGQVVSLNVTVIDISGPRVIAQTPSVPVLGSIDSVRVTFDEAVNADSFTSSDISSFTGPAGAITATSVEAVTGSGNMQFDIRFSRQTAIGSYSLLIGPDLLDLADNLMNQDGDSVNGEIGQDGYALSFAVQSPGADFNWVKGVGGSSFSEIAYGMTTDASGNLYVTGSFRGTVNFDPGVTNTTRTSINNDDDIFVAKFTSSGAFVWVTAMGGASSSEIGQGIAVDSAGNAYVTGFFAGTSNFGAVALTSQGPNNAFLAKLNSSGTVQWANRMGGTMQAIGTGIAVDASGVYTTGVFQGTANFGGTSRTSNGDRDIFVTKWNLSGTLQWVSAFGSTGYDYGYGIALDASSNVFASGLFNGTMTVGSDTLNSAGTGFGYAVKLNSSTGSAVWAKATGGYGLAVAASPSGDIYIGGAFESTIDADPGTSVFPMTSSGREDIFVSRLGADGAFKWADQFGGSDYDRAYAIAVDATGNVFTAGMFGATADFDPGNGIYNLNSRGSEDIFISKVDANGSFGWARALGSTNNDRAYAIAIDGARVDVAGFYNGTLQSDPGGSVPINLAPIGNWDVVLAQLGAPAVNDPPVIGTITDKTVDEGSTLSFTVTATDPNAGQTKSFSLDPGAPAGATIAAGTGVFSWTPTESQGPATYLITVRVTDNGIPESSAAKTFTVTVNEVNEAPVLDTLSDQSVFEGTLLAFTVTATDVDRPNQTLRYRLAPGAPTGTTIDENTGEFAWRPTESQGPDTFSITVVVNDNGSPMLGDSQTLTIFVKEANQTPVLAPIGSRTVNEGALLSFTAVATDPDLPSNTLRFSLGPDAPTGATIDETTGEFNWTPTSSQAAAVHPVTIIVTDNGVPSNADFETIMIRVNARPTNISLSANSVSENAVGATIGTVTVTDPDVGDTHTFTVSDSRFEIVNDKLKLKAGQSLNFESSPSVILDITARDAGGLEFTKSFTISVTNVTELNAIDVQKGQMQRSFVRYLDILFDQGGTDLFNLISNNRLQLTRYDLNGENGMVSAFPTSTVSGSQIQLDFGTQGIGGNRGTNAGDGYYELGIDMDGNGSFESKKFFHRLLGDVTGNGIVDAADKSQVLAAQGTTSAESDANGDGFVNVADTLLVTRAVGRKLKGGLFRDD